MFHGAELCRALVFRLFGSSHIQFFSALTCCFVIVWFTVTSSLRTFCWSKPGAAASRYTVLVSLSYTIEVFMPTFKNNDAKLRYSNLFMIADSVVGTPWCSCRFCCPANDVKLLKRTPSPTDIIHSWSTDTTCMPSAHYPRWRKWDAIWNYQGICQVMENTVWYSICSQAVSCFSPLTAFHNSWSMEAQTCD